MDMFDGVRIIPIEELPQKVRLNGGSVIGISKENGAIEFTEPRALEITEPIEIQISGRKK